MIDPSPYRANALAEASLLGGEYIESIAKTDLATFTATQWATLVEVIVTAYQDHLSSAYADDPPF